MRKMTPLEKATGDIGIGGIVGMTAGIFIGAPMFVGIIAKLGADISWKRVFLQIAPGRGSSCR